MKGKPIYSIRAETRRHSFSLLDFSWECVQQIDSIFAPLNTYPKMMTMSVQLVLILRLWINFSK